VRGAFSGASRDRQGRFLLADGGSLFLDEVGEIPFELQGKLLRVLQERTFEAVGDDRTRRVDVRVIAATNRPLEVEVERGRFRRDLYYRLSVLPIEVPPLRERREDILPMAERFMRAAAERLHVPARELTPEERDVLVAYDFPGNVRELQNIIERAMVLEPTGRSALAREVARVTPKAAESAKPPAPDARTVLAEDGFRSLERQNVVNALEQCGWRVAGPGGAAELLGVRPSTLAYRLKRLGIERPR
jgi:transcriptional regulator with GAF, ATPase, and Fis domain